jgi:hypothetical protein
MRWSVRIFHRHQTCSGKAALLNICRTTASFYTTLFYLYVTLTFKILYQYKPSMTVFFCFILFENKNLPFLRLNSNYGTRKLNVLFTVPSCIYRPRKCDCYNS